MIAPTIKPMTNLRIYLVAFLTFLFFVCAVIFISFGMYKKTPISGLSGETAIGKPAPDFSLVLTSGEYFRLSDNFGNPIIINFWNPYCPPCAEESPILEDIWLKYRSERLLVLGIDSPVINAPEEATSAYIKNFNLSFPIGRDLGAKITIDYGVLALPVTFFIDSRGEVEFRKVGLITHEEISTWLDSLGLQDY